MKIKITEPNKKGKRKIQYIKKNAIKSISVYTYPSGIEYRRKIRQ